jgi:type VI secretion system secreted protein Hcp
LENAMIASYSASSGGDRPMESFSINFTKIEYKYTPFDDKHKAGTPVPVKYDLTTASAK